MSISAGFKLDTLLRLADVKGTDRRTSLLAFVTSALLARGEGDVGSLPDQLSSIRAAANLQASLRTVSSQPSSAFFHCLIRWPRLLRQEAVQTQFVTGHGAV